MLTLELEQWSAPSAYRSYRNLIYGWSLNKLFIKELIGFNDTYVITKVKRIFDPTINMNNSCKIDQHIVIVYIC